MSLPRSVTCLVRGPYGLILGVSRRGRPTEFGLPGGKVDPGESLAEAAARELKEETGLVIRDAAMIYWGQCLGEVTYVNYVFQGTVEGEIKAEEGLVVAMVTQEVLFAGPFGEYNRRLLSALG